MFFRNHETRNTVFSETRLLRFIGRQTFLLERTSPPPMVFTKHESRNTAFMLSCPLFPFFDGKLLRTSAERGIGYVHMSAYHSLFSVGFTTSSVRRNMNPC